MQTQSVSLPRITAFVILLFLLVYLLIIGKTLFTPLAFGALFAFMLKPICTFIERGVKWRIPAIFLTMVVASVPVALLFYFFSTQLMNVFQDMPSIMEKINAGVEVLYNWAKNTFGYSQAETENFIKEQLPKLLNQPMAGLGGGVLSSTSFVTGFILTIIYTFLFLLYRSAFKNFVMVQTDESKRGKVTLLMGKVQIVIQKYLYGLFLVILIVGTLNTLGLWIIGIDHPLFWGFLAAMLAIIPYVGTFIGGLLPFLYALATADQSWQPFAVVVLFLAIQTLEGNLITPNIVGSTIKVNALAAIIALLAGAEIWGIAGMILSLPAIAILKEFLVQSDAWKPVGHLLSDDISNGQNTFNIRWDMERFRLRNFFKGPK